MNINQMSICPIQLLPVLPDFLELFVIAYSIRCQKATEIKHLVTDHSEDGMNQRMFT
jgi:hypothetical protein